MVGYRFAEIEETAGAYQRRKAEQNENNSVDYGGRKGGALLAAQQKKFSQAVFIPHE